MPQGTAVPPSLGSSNADESSELAPGTVEFVRRGLVVGLVGVVGVAFTVSWTALHDVGRAIGLADLGAVLYPLAADGPIALALVASLILAGRHRRAALLVLGVYTCASLILNYVHGLVPLEGTRPRLSPVPWVHYVLVGLASALPVASIFFGADLVTRALRRARPGVDTGAAPVDTPVSPVPEVPVAAAPPAPPVPPVEVPAVPEPEPERAPLVICDRDLPQWLVESTPVPEPEPASALPESEEPQPELPAPDPEPVRELSAAEAAAVIEQCWRDGELSIRDTAERATRSKSYVAKAFTTLADRYGPRPVRGQLEMAGVTG
jgi:hypothetical protein